MRWRPLSVVLLALALLLISIDPLQAHTRRRRQAGPVDQGFEISTLLVHTQFEDRVEIADEIGFGFRFGYLFTPHHEVEALFHFVSTEDEVFPAIDIDTFHFQFAYLYNFRSEGVIPYLTAGIGFLDVDDDALGSETNGIFGAGGGIRFFFNPVVHFRLEYRFNQFEGDGQVFVNGEDFDFNEFSFGIGWRFPSH